MSKAVAEVIPSVVGIEIAWIDPWNKPPVGTRLYTASHAEELAKLLSQYRTQIDVTASARFGAGDLCIELAKQEVLESQIDGALASYREAMQ